MNKSSLPMAFLAATIFTASTCTATVIESFTATATGTTPFIGAVGTGTFSYDETALTNIGVETLDPVSGSVTVDFTMFGQSFAESDDIDFNFFPTLSFTDGVVESINYILSEDSLGLNPISIDDPLVFEIVVVSDLTPDGSGGFLADALVFPFGIAATVPEPSTLVATVMALIIVANGRRRRSVRS